MHEYHNRELSWLEFNQRVLDQALKDSGPLLERVKFLAITASNLDEFFQVRVGSLMLQKRSGRKTRDNSGYTPTRNLSAIRERVLKMNEDQYKLLTQILLPALAEKGIFMLSAAQLSDAQRAQTAAIFEDNISPLLTPLAVDPDSPPPNVPALHIVLACRLVDPADESTRHVLIPIHENLPRRISVQTDDGNTAFILIEDLVAAHAYQLFPGETVAATTAFRVTRNGDIAVEEDDTTDLADEMEDVLTARRFADTVRLEMRDDAPRDLALMIRTVTASTAQEIYRHDGPLGLASFMELAFLPDFDHLRDEEWPAQSSPSITPGVSMFETIAANDV